MNNNQATNAKSTRYVIDHYEIDCPDEEAAIIEDIMKMNGGSDKQIIIENLRGWFYSQKPSYKLAGELYTEMLDGVDWNTVYNELSLDVNGRK